MSLCKRVIPCLDVDNGRVVKGTKFVELRDAGDPVEIAKRYNNEGADEITFLDITASSDNRNTILSTITSVASEVFIPLTVGGGVRTVEDVRTLLKAGADKVGINTAAIKNPDFVKEAADKFGSQCIVIAVDVKREYNDPPRWSVYTHGGRNKTSLDAKEWVKLMEQNGAGELLLTSMDVDGTKKGYDLAFTKMVSEEVEIPIIASGGVGEIKHLIEGVTIGGADAVLAASIFHFDIISIQQVKNAFRESGINVRDFN